MLFHNVTTENNFIIRIKIMFIMGINVAVVLFTLFGVLSGAPVHSKDTERLSSEKKNFIDGIEEANVPTKYKDIAMICELYRKLNALTTDLDSETLSKDINSDRKPVISESNDLSEVKDYDSQHTILAESVKEWLEELTSDARTESDIVDILDGEQAVRKERVRRNTGSGIPQELLQMLQGVCVTDKCLQVVREYFEWRRKNGYPVYTDVTQI